MYDWKSEMSFDGIEYICNTCYANLKNGKMPKYAVINGNELPYVPPDHMKILYKFPEIMTNYKRIPRNSRELQWIFPGISVT